MEQGQGFLSIRAPSGWETTEDGMYFPSSTVLFSQPCCITIELFALNEVSFFIAPQIGIPTGVELAPTTIG